jgi:tellurite resistance protein
MGFQRLLGRLKPLAQHLERSAPEAEAADGVSGFAAGFDARPWLSRLSPTSAQLFCAVFEAGFLIAQADGRFDRAERAHLHRALLALSDDGILADDVDAMLSGFTASLSRDGAAARSESVGRLLQAHHVGEAGVFLAAGIACASDGLSQIELKTLEVLARHAGLGFDRLALLVEAIRVDLAAPD